MSGQQLLMVGNSVSMPSDDASLSYVQRLERTLAPAWATVSMIRSGATIDEIESGVMSAIDAHRPAALVLQVGINECAPRPLRRREREVLSRFRPARVRRLIVSLLHRYRPSIIRLRGVQQLTPLPVFAASVGRVVLHAAGAGAQVLILPITRIPRVAEGRTPFTNREVERYNAALAALAGPAVRFVTEAMLFGDQSPDDYCAGPTTVHLNASAHDRIASFVHQWITATCS